MPSLESWPCLSQIEKIGDVFVEAVKDKVYDCLEYKLDIGEISAGWECVNANDGSCLDSIFMECLKEAIDQIIMDAFEASRDREFEYKCIDSEADLWKNARKLLFGV